MISLLAFLPFQNASIQTPSPAQEAIAREREAYRIDLARTFYTISEDRDKDRQRVATLNGTLFGLRGKIGASKENLLLALTTRDESDAIQAKLGIASTVAALLDTRKAGVSVSSGGAREGGEDTFEDELAAISPGTFDAYVAAEPRLAPYRFRFEEARRAKAHRLSPHDESILARFGQYADGWQKLTFEGVRRDAPSNGGKAAPGSH